jgi:hypothetical protein
MAISKPDDASGVLHLEHCRRQSCVARIDAVYRFRYLAVIDPVPLCHLERSRSVCDDVVERSMYLSLHFKTGLLLTW